MCIRGYRLKGYTLDISRLRNDVTGFTGKVTVPGRTSGKLYLSYERFSY
jgi:hypothetical protein